MADTKQPDETALPADPNQTSDTSKPIVKAEVPHVAESPTAKSVVMKLSFKDKLKEKIVRWWSNPKARYGTLGVILVIIVALFGIPFTRYNILGLALKSQTTVHVVDSKTGLPVTGATISIGGKTAQTDATGKAVVYPHLGSKQLAVSKKYYRSTSQKELVAVAATKNNFKAKLVALGRQVQIKVVDKISNQPLSGAELSAQGAKAKTDTAGLATLVLASDSDTAKVSITRSGYTTTNATITAAGNLAKNTFGVVASGKLYFLSNLSGDIDVVKTNLDGSSRQTVLTGSGNEDPNSTSLLASRDWKYMALLSKRSGSNASVYLIDATNGDKLTTIDQSDADFTLVGWSGDTFVYQVAKHGVQQWQSNAYALKSYDATSGQTTLLDQSSAEGTSLADYGYTSYSSVYILGNELFYAKNWYGSSQVNHLAGKSSTLTSIRADGSGHKIVKTFPVPDGAAYYSVNLSLYEPNGVYVQVPDATGTTNAYYEYENGSLASKTDVTDTQFNAPYATYLLSPSGTSTFWSQQRDGKNTLFVGNADGKSGKQIATLSDYKPYGWYTDNYLLVSKNSSELYLMPKNGGTPLKVSDYYKPPISYNGYGGGYGGL